MIGTEQERAALMALVARFGNSMSGETREDPDDLYAAIRAMLAPDDAVVIPRDLAFRAIDRIERLAWWETECGEDEIARGSQIDADIFHDVLRGEATRDE